MKTKIKSREELIQIVRKTHEDGKVVVATSGCFDILHAGHVTYLEEAASKGDVFILLLNSDSSVRALKGISRPIIPESERAIVTAALECVDYVCIFNELTPESILNDLKPDVFVKGGDYKGKEIPEIKVMENIGGHVEYVSMVEGWSSTKIIEKIGIISPSKK